MKAKRAAVLILNSDGTEVQLVGHLQRYINDADRQGVTLHIHIPGKVLGSTPIYGKVIESVQAKMQADIQEAFITGRVRLPGREMKAITQGPIDTDAEVTDVGNEG